MAHSLNVFLLSIKVTAVCILIAADIFLVTLLLVSFHSPQLHTNGEQASGKLPSFQLNVQRATQAINNKTGDSLKTIGHTVSSVADAVSTTTSNVAQSVATTVTNPETIIKPEPSYKTPEIKDVAQTPAATGTGGPATNQPAPAATAPVIATAPQQPQVSVWPIHGAVTTEFGVYHQPFQPWHTGIDISSGQPAGRTAVSPFRDGVVVQVTRSYQGLGNHVVIDHGGGLTSWYGHLYSITVAQGQAVHVGDTIGYEGRTGAATGPHVHLEIRQNNVPLNPRNFIANNP